MNSYMHSAIHMNYTKNNSRYETLKNVDDLNLI